MRFECSHLEWCPVEIPTLLLRAKNSVRQLPKRVLSAKYHLLQLTSKVDQSGVSSTIREDQNQHQYPLFVQYSVIVPI